MLLEETAAFLYGDCERLMELPQEDARSSNPNMVARLIESLYGTRDAAQLWARHVGKTLSCLGYTETKWALGVYYQKEKDVEITLHVEDFLVVGRGRTSTGSEGGPEYKVYKRKGLVLAPDEGDSKEGVYLGRRIQWCDWGIETEGNQHPGAAKNHRDGVGQTEDNKDDNWEKTDFQGI